MANWFKENAGTVAAVGATITAVVTLLQLIVVGPLNRRFDKLETKSEERISTLTEQMNRRFTEQVRNLDRLDRELAEFRELMRAEGKDLSRVIGKVEVLQDQNRALD